MRMFKRAKTWLLLVAAGLLAVAVPVVMAGVRPFEFMREAQLVHATGPMPQYEVATVKPAKDDGVTPYSFIPQGPSVFAFHNFTLKSILAAAYGIRSTEQLEGVPKELGYERFNIEVKLSDAEVAAEQNLPFQEMATRRQLIMQQVLTDRFHLKTSEVMKEVPVYELVLAKGGPKLKPTAMEDDPARPGEKKPVGRMGTQAKVGSMQTQAAPLSQLAISLGRLPELGLGDFVGSGRMVIDKTGVKGFYDWTLTWSPASASGAAVNPDAPGLFAALEEQLGMKLVPAKAPVQVLVVEHIERPSEN